MTIPSLTIKTAFAALLLSAAPALAEGAPYCADPAYPNLRNGRCYQ